MRLGRSYLDAIHVCRENLQDSPQLGSALNNLGNLFAKLGSRYVVVRVGIGLRKRVRASTCSIAHLLVMTAPDVREFAGVCASTRLNAC